METRAKVILVTLVFAVLGFMLSPNAPLGNMIWPQNPSLSEHYGAPTGGEIALLMGYGVLQAIAFGLGVAFIFFGWPLVNRAGASKSAALGAYVGIAWLLVSWVPHDALHQHITSMAALVGLEYGFHLTLMIGGLLIARWFLQTVRAPTGGARPA